MAKSLLTGAQILLNYVQHIFPGEGRTFSWGGLARPSKGPVPDTATGSLNITNFSSKRIFAKNIARPTKLECIVPDSVFFFIESKFAQKQDLSKISQLEGNIRGRFAKRGQRRATETTEGSLSICIFRRICLFV